MAINLEKLRAPHYMFFIYMLAASLVIMIFKFIFPGSEAPLLLYSRDWRIIQGLLLLFNLFPALALSALVIPFGVASSYEEEFQSFSEMFFKKLSGSIILAIIAMIMYGIIFFLALPIAENRANNIRFSGELYKLARANIYEYSQKSEWREAAEFLKICDNIWYNNPELADIRLRINLNLDELRYEELKEEERARAVLSRDYRSASMTTLTGGTQPVTAAEAISMARTFFDQKRYFDAHWLALLAGRLAVPGSPEVRTSAGLASEAWNKISEQAPNFLEQEKYRLFEKKLDGYKAMEAGEEGQNNEWIRAYYIFKELSELTPDDPDVKKFLAKSEQGAKETAFFIDEMEKSLGENLTRPVFSLPGNVASQGDAGRVVMRFSNLTTQDDVAYGFDFEYMSFDDYARPIVSVQSLFAKLSPIITNGTPQILVLMHALNREDENHCYNAKYLLGQETPGGILIDISFEDFLLLGEIRQGLHNLHIGELFEAANKINNAGYVPEVFHAEILNRLGTTFFFLPMSIFIIIIAWRYRAKKRPRYLFSVMLPVLPVVFNGFVFLYRSIFNTLGIWLVISLGFTVALTIFIVILAASLFGALIVLAAQHS